MALAKTHQTYIEAELDKDIQRELDSRSQKNQSSIKKSPQQQVGKIHVNKNNAEINAEKNRSDTNTPYIEKGKFIVTKLWYVSLAVIITLKHRLEKIVKRLTKKGRRLSAKIKARKLRRQTIAHEVDVAKSATKPAAKITAVDKIHHLEHSIEDSLDRGRNNTLHWIGVPSQSDFNKLAHQVELLSEKIEFLEQELEQSGRAQNKVNRTVIA